MTPAGPDGSDQTGQRMRRAIAAAIIAAVAAAVAVVAVTTAGPDDTVRPRSPHRPPASYYLSLGDSLSQGVQPDRSGASVPTGQGYPDQLYAMLHASDPGLRLVKLGCSGETTSTMIHGGICAYRGGSQLAAAVRFLRAHRGRVSLITIDIGANDPNSCIFHPSLGTITHCVRSAIPGAVGNLARILQALRAAGGSKVRIIGMNYYVPELAEWRNGLAGRALARLSAQLGAGLNYLLTRAYGAAGARVADVAGAFRTGDFTGRLTRSAAGTVPPNVALICSLTWACAQPPRGPDEHANAAGYRVIAQAFRRADAR
jgi:lysophospholipase L1-like esterase